MSSMKTTEHMKVNAKQDTNLNTRISVELLEAMKAYCDKYGVSASRFIRYAIHTAIENDIYKSGSAGSSINRT